MDIYSDHIPPLALSKLEDYKRLLQRFNKALNLYSRSPQFSLESLFNDSLIGAKALERVFKETSHPVLDIGSGNGFPGLVCAVLYPEIPFVLCDRSLKKTEFLRHCVFELNCSNVKVLCREAALLEAKFALILSKGTSSLTNLLKIFEKILDSKGKAFLWKNSGAEAHWPEHSPFFGEIFKTYQMEGKERILLKVQRKKGAEIYQVKVKNI